MGGFAPNTENTSYIPQEVRETRRIILDANNARQMDAALPTTADMSSPQTYEAGVTRQPAESTSRALSNGHSTITKIMGIDTGNLRHRVPSLPTPSHPEVPLFDWSYRSTLTTATPGEWTGPKTISTPPLTHYLCATSRSLFLASSRLRDDGVSGSVYVAGAFFPAAIVFSRCQASYKNDGKGSSL